jgi:hypothetical protein
MPLVPPDKALLAQKFRIGSPPPGSAALKILLYSSIRQIVMLGSRSPGAWALVPCGVVETTMGGAHMEGEHIPTSWVGRRVRLITVVTADRTSQEEGVLLNLDQLGITIRRPLLAGSDEQEVVFHPWMHVYQLGPLIRE